MSKGQSGELNDVIVFGGFVPFHSDDIKMGSAGSTPGLTAVVK